MNFATPETIGTCYNCQRSVYLAPAEGGYTKHDTGLIRHNDCREAAFAAGQRDGYRTAIRMLRDATRAIRGTSPKTTESVERCG